ncbi:MAG: hypothetical protein QM740_19170 [Acidovorax sp.]
MLEVIACRMGTLNDLLMMLAQKPGMDWEAGVLINTAQYAAEAVGAMADDAVGGVVTGDMHHWLYGPNFADAGKQGSAA